MGLKPTISGRVSSNLTSFLTQGNTLFWGLTVVYPYPYCMLWTWIIEDASKSTPSSPGVKASSPLTSKKHHHLVLKHTAYTPTAPALGRRARFNWSSWAASTHDTLSKTTKPKPRGFPVFLSIMTSRNSRPQQGRRNKNLSYMAHKKEQPNFDSTEMTEVISLPALMDTPGQKKHALQNLDLSIWVRWLERRKLHKCNSPHSKVGTNGYRVLIQWCNFINFDALYRNVIYLNNAMEAMLLSERQENRIWIHDSRQGINSWLSKQKYSK